DRASSMGHFRDKIQQAINQFDKHSYLLVDDPVVLFRNFLKYQDNQIEKIGNIECLLHKRNNRKLLPLKNEDVQSLLTKQSYALKLIFENFNFRNSIFRHSLRLAVSAMLGYGIGWFFELEKPYWILLTIIVIMRPTYGLTKTRFKNRVIGTLIGGAAAVGLVLLIHNKTFYAILAILTLIIAYSMIRRNYKAAAAFVTINVVFTYALLQTEVFSVIQFRVRETLIGAVLAIAGNTLWPSWEIRSLEKTLVETLEANRIYLKNIAEFYTVKNEISPTYKLSRKKAFLALS